MLFQPLTSRKGTTILENPESARNHQVSQILSQAYANGGGTLLVDGLSGMGKTYFLRNLAIQAQQHDRWNVTYVSADQIERGEPYSFIERVLAAGIAPEWNFEPEAAQQPIGVAREVVRRINGNPSHGHVLIIDDAQWIDATSEQVFRHLIPRLNRRNVLIACGARTPHEASSLGTLLAQSAATYPQDHHVEMTPLNEQDIRALAMQRFGVTISQRNAARLSELTGGSFLGVDSILNQVTKDEISRLHTTWDLPIRSTKIQNPLLGAYRELSVEAQRLVQIVCIAAHEIPPATLIQVTQELGISPVIDEPIRAGVIMESGFGQSIVPQHALTATAIRETVEPSVARRIHRTLSHLTEGFRSVVHTLKGAESWNTELQHHAEQYARAASEQLQYENASEILRMALDLAQQPQDRERLITELVLINVRAKTGFQCLDLLPELETFPPTMLREFLAVMLRVYLVNEAFPDQRVQRVLQTTQPTPDESTLQAFLLFMMVMMLMRSTDRSKILELIPVAKQLFAKGPNDPAELDDARLAWMVMPTEYILLLDCYEIVQWHLNGDVKATREALPELLSRTARLPSVAIKVDCLVPLAGAAMATGDTILAHDIAAQAVNLLDHVIGEPWAAATPRIILAHILVLQGQYQHATQLLDELDEVSHEALDLESRLTGAALRASIAAVTGKQDPHQYMTHAHRASDIHWEHYGRDLPIMAALEIARTQDDPVSGLKAASQLPTATISNTQHGFLTYKAHALITHGDLVEAQDLISDLQQRHGHSWFEYWGSLAWLQARMDQATNNPTTARKHYEVALELKTFPLPWALTAIDYGEFLLSLDEPDAAESVLHQGITGLEKIGATAYLPKATRQLELAVEQNRKTQVNALEAMTKREREVAALLAEGHSNKSIAKQLVVSESTARFHVSNILRKLQLTSRSEVPRVFNGFK